VISQSVLIVAEAFGERLSAPLICKTLEDALQRERPGLILELCELADYAGEPDGSAELRDRLRRIDFDRRMRAARAVVLCRRSLETHTLTRSATFEVATRARQAGVPSYAITALNKLDLFQARVLDLQLIIQAASRPALRRAATRLSVVL
jgi:glycerate kinase